MTHYEKFGHKDEAYLIDKIVECRRKRFAKDGYSFNVEESHLLAKEIINPVRNQYQWDLVLRFVPIRKDMKILEIGSGHGAFIVKGYNKGCDVIGIEADKDILSVSKEIVEYYGVSPKQVSHAYGENLPFSDNQFDVVISASVLEHVQNVNMVISESIRVTKPGGIIIHNFPNYRSFFEGHFKCLWLPFLGHCSGKRFIKFLDKIKGNPNCRVPRDYDYLDTLKLTSLRTVRDTYKSHPEIEFVSLGKELWFERLEDFDFDAYQGMEMLKTVVNITKRLHLIKVVAWLGVVLGFYTPIVMVLRKKRT